MDDLVKKSLDLCVEINRVLETAETHDAAHSSLMTALLMSQVAQNALVSATQNVGVHAIGVDVHRETLKDNAPVGLSADDVWGRYAFMIEQEVCETTEDAVRASVASALDGLENESDLTDIEELGI